ncbi:hypothetical protein ES703_96742 [subsurface metagenome]
MNKDEILKRYLALHDALGAQKDAPDKDKFDREHREIWTECDLELKERKAELEAKRALTDDERLELAALEEMLPW